MIVSRYPGQFSLNSQQFFVNSTICVVAMIEIFVAGMAIEREAESIEKFVRSK